MNPGNDEYYVGGKLHRENGPAFVEYYNNGSIKSQSYYIKGKLNRKDNGQTIIDYHINGNKRRECYCLNSIIYRKVGPAVIEYFFNGSKKCEKYKIHDSKFHCMSGPELIEYSVDGKVINEKYYIEGIKVSERVINIIKKRRSILTKLVKERRQRKMLNILDKIMIMFPRDLNKRFVEFIY